MPEITFDNLSILTFKQLINLRDEKRDELRAAMQEASAVKGEILFLQSEIKKYKQS